MSWIVAWLDRQARSLSLRGRVALSFVAVFVTTLAVLFVTLHVALRGLLIADLDGDLERYAHAIVADATAEGRPASVGELVRASTSGLLERLAGVPIVTGIFDGGGELVRASRAMPADGRVLRRGELARLREGESIQRTIRTDQNQDLRLNVTPVLRDGVLIAAVETAAPLKPVTAAMERLQTLLVVEAVIATAVAAVAGSMVASRGLQPLQRMATLAADIEARDLTGRLRLGAAPSEIRALAETFDAMLDRLERAFTLQRNFALDVAHELRTPLTALKGNFDVLLLDPGLAPDLRDEIERLSAETGRMMRLTHNLLSLAQAEAGRKLDLRPVDLDMVCLEVYQQARGLHPGVRLRLGHEDQVTIHGDQDLLKQLVLNLVENAMKYTPAGGEVTLSLFNDGDAARIVVEDNGPGIRPEDRPHIFERFYRAPVGQGRVTRGAGIGLAVARWIATEHRGTIDVVSEVGRGSAFSVWLPAYLMALPGRPQGERHPARL
jgi:two-component system, OmpR family, sensor kinase